MQLHIEVAIEAGSPNWVELWEDIANDVFVFDRQEREPYDESLDSTTAQDDPRVAKTLCHMLQSASHRLQGNRPMGEIGEALSLLQSEYHNARSRENRFENSLRSALYQYRWRIDLSRKLIKTKGFLEIMTVAPIAADWNKLSHQKQASLLKPFEKEQQEQLKKQLAHEPTNISDEVKELSKILIPNLVENIKVAKQSAERFLALLEKRYPG